MDSFLCSVDRIFKPFMWLIVPSELAFILFNSFGKTVLLVALAYAVFISWFAILVHLSEHEPDIIS